MEKDGTEFGNDKEKVMILIRDLYDFKLSGVEQRDMIAEMILDLGYKPSIPDTDVWINPDTN